jgi:hypothetical protein
MMPGKTTRGNIATLVLGYLLVLGPVLFVMTITAIIILVRHLLH